MQLGSKLLVLAYLWTSATVRRDNRYRCGRFFRQSNNLVGIDDIGDVPTAIAPGRACDTFESLLPDLPPVTYSARDVAPYLTSTMFLTKEPAAGFQNLSFHRSSFVHERFSSVPGCNPYLTGRAAVPPASGAAVIV
jgi:hypothetical protein